MPLIPSPLTEPCDWVVTEIVMDGDEAIRTVGPMTRAAATAWADMAIQTRDVRDCLVSRLQRPPLT